MNICPMMSKPVFDLENKKLIFLGEVECIKARCALWINKKQFAWYKRPDGYEEITDVSYCSLSK